ncbi:MAG: beta-propeller fold lactonase family protein, partial [Desulfovibrio sp.]|nr:beta-propeller fold lactonase family protein [Desulfovibrio sp.]
GDNTVGIIDISSADPQKFVYTSHLVVGLRMDTSRVHGNRDNNCGNCLRGTVFSPDSKYLFVGRMGGGGITCFSMPEGKLVGSFSAFCATPRHLDIGPSGSWLYAGSNSTGFISRVRLQDVITALGSAEGRAINGPEGEKLYVGKGLRTIAISQDGKYLYAAVNGESQLAQVDIASWRVVRKVAVSPFSVGLAVSPDGTHVVVTSQGKGEQGGGNSIEVFRTTIQ